MSKYYISINPLAEFANSSKAGKQRIIKQQISPNKLLIPWYQKAKGALKKYFANVNIYTPINEAIESLDNKVPTNKRQIIDKNVSLEALRKVIDIEKPQLLHNLSYVIVGANDKFLNIDNVDIRIAPDVIIRGKYQGKTVYGAVKFHISKTKPFDANQAVLVSTLLYQYLRKKISHTSEVVLPELCLCFDVFGERLVPAPENISKQLILIKGICEEIKQVWPKTA